MSTNNRDFIKCLMQSGQRIDGREPLQNRDLKVLFGSGDMGSVEVEYGDSRVYTTTNASIVVPHVARPQEGFLNFRVDLEALREDGQGANAIHFGINASSHQKYQMEIEKILERMIKTSKALDVESLVISSGKSVWSIAVKTVVINNQGNLIDSVYLSVILSLLHFRRPQVQIIPQQGLKIFTKQEKRYMPLSIHHVPLAFTFALLEDTLCIDPTLEEEMVCTGRITIGLNVYGDVCYVHKIGGLPIVPKIISQYVQCCKYLRIMMVALAKVQAFTQQLRSLIENSNNINFSTNKASFILSSVHHFSLPLSEQNNQIDIEELEQTLNKRVQ